MAGPSSALEFALIFSIFGGILTIMLIELRRFRCCLAIRYEWSNRLLTPGGEVPYGVAMAAAAS